MIQEIITYIILAATLIVAGYRLYQTMRSLNNRKQMGGSCAGCSTECSIKDLKKKSACSTHYVKTKSIATTP